MKNNVSACMKRCFLFLCLGLYTQLAYAQKVGKVTQFIPNPAFQVTYNELEAAKTLQKMGQKSVILTPAESLKKVAEKINRDTTTHSKIDGWVLWKDLNQKSQTNRKSEAIKNHTHLIYLDVAQPAFFGTYLNAPLEAGKTYMLVMEYVPSETIHTLPPKQLPKLGFVCLPTAPIQAQASIKPNKEYKFKQDKNAKDYKRRQEVIDRYSKEYGGNYENKEWNDFQGKKNRKNRYETITYTFKAKGGEQYLVLGNFRAKNNLQQSVFITMKSLYLREKSDYSTIHDGN